MWIYRKFNGREVIAFPYNTVGTGQLGRRMMHMVHVYGVGEERTGERFTFVLVLCVYVQCSVLCTMCVCVWCRLFVVPSEWMCGLWKGPTTVEYWNLRNPFFSQTRESSARRRNLG